MDEFNENFSSEPAPEAEPVEKAENVQESKAAAPPVIPQNTNPQTARPYGYGGYTQPNPAEPVQNNIPPRQDMGFEGYRPPQGQPYGYNPPTPPNVQFNGQPPIPPQGQPDYYRMTYGVPRPVEPPKEKMSGGLKAFLAIAITLLVCCLAGFISYVAITSGDNKELPNNDSSFNFTMPGIFGDYDTPETTTPQKEQKVHNDTDAQKETDPSYSGVKLEKKATSNDKNYGASYTFNKVKSSVVAILCYETDDTSSDTGYGQGTGIVVDERGYIVTNSHVIGDSRTAYAIKVVTDDKKEYKARVVGFDSRTDLAVLKIDAKGLPVAAFGNSDEIEITEDVIAIGNPKGMNFQNSVTKGIVSAVNREAVSTKNNVKYIQTDAPINPGNSGGPLCNMYGQVIGINTSKIVLQDYESMGFAIPSKDMKKVVDDIIKYNHVQNRVRIGITGTAVYDNEKEIGGIQIAEISKGGPMDGTGAEADDIITKVDGKKISSFAEVYDILEQHKVGDKIRIGLYRPSTGKDYDVTVTLQADEN